jgi:hypothetical protein
MIEPRRFGRFLAADKFGYVQPDVALERIDRKWRPLVDVVARALMQRGGVRSVYVRGSIPRGLSIEHVSDADFIYFSEIDFDQLDRDLEDVVKAEFPFVSEVSLFRLGRAQLDKIHHPQRRPYFHMLIKTQSVLLAGDDVAKLIEPFRIAPEMISHVFALENEFVKSQQWLLTLPASRPNEQKKTDERSVRRWISKRIVRSGFEVTMNRTEHFTRDLYLCYEQFSMFYPEHAKQMYQVLVNCLNGGYSASRYGELAKFVAGEGVGLLAGKYDNRSLEPRAPLLRVER